MRTDRTDFLGLSFDLQSEGQVLDRLSRSNEAMPYSYVVTPNVDHMVRLHQSEETERSLKPLYDGADLCLCDSQVLQILARARGLNLPVVPGSELTALLFERVIHAGDRIGIVGGDTELLDRLSARYPHVD